MMETAPGYVVMGLPKQPVDAPVPKVLPRAKALTRVYQLKAAAIEAQAIIAKGGEYDCYIREVFPKNRNA